jgi:hypothetical protein
MAGFIPAIHVWLFLSCKHQDVDARDTGERSDAVLRTAMPGHDGDSAGATSRYSAQAALHLSTRQNKPARQTHIDDLSADHRRGITTSLVSPSVSFGTTDKIPYPRFRKLDYIPIASFVRGASGGVLEAERGRRPRGS